MKRQSKSTRNPFMTMVLKSVIVTCFLLLTQFSSSIAQVYARIEIDNVVTIPSPYVIQTYGNAYVRFYSDYACTTPVAISNNISLNVTYDADSDLPNSGGWLDPDTFSWDANANDTEADLGFVLLSEYDYNDEYNTDQKNWVLFSHWLEGDGNGDTIYIPLPTVINN